MASRQSTIELIFRGITRGLTGAAAQARRAAQAAEDAERNLANARRDAQNAAGRLQGAEDSLQAARSQHDAALSRIGVAETNLERVRARSGDASTRLSQAEAELSRVRRNGSTEEIQRAEAEVTRVREQSDTAASALQAAEARLASARANGDSSAAGLLRAEENLARARRDNEAALGRLGDAEERNRRAQDDLNNSNRNGRGGFRDLLAGIVGVIRPFTELAGLVGDTSTKMGAFGAALGGIGGPIVQAVVGLLEMAAVMGAIVEIVGVVGGVIGQVVGGAIPLLLSLAVAAGTVALGMDGIKKAAEVMQPAFEKLKTAVSDTFTRLLTPTFRELATVFPKITGGLTEMAGAVSNVITRLVGIAASKAGIQDLQFIIAGATDMIDAMTDGLGVFVKGLLDMGRAAAPAMQALGDAIGSIFGRLGEVFQRLAGDGTIQKVVEGLAATIKGLGAVLAPVIELLIRMGAALGDSVGVALTDVGAGIQQVIPFFEHLAKVAGELLVEAFKQLGPPLKELVASILPGANQGLDGFAAVVKNVVLPAIAGFINWLRTDGIPGIVAFTRGAIVQGLEFAKSMVAVADTVLGVFQGLFTALALIPGPFQQQFAEGAAVITAYRGELDKTKATINSIESKTVAFTVQVPSDRTTGEQGALGVAAAMDRVQPKTVAVTANVPSAPLVGEQGILGVVAAQERVQPKTVTVTANVPSGPTTGTLGNQVLEGAIGAVINKSVTTTSNVPGTPVVGTQGNQALTSAIGQVRDKTTTTRSNVVGESEVRSLKGAIDLVKDKTVTVNVVVKGAGAIPKFAAGGRVPTSGAFMVGEKGPELLTLDALGGVITPAAKTERLLNARRNQRFKAAAVGADPGSTGGEAPIVLNVMLSREYFAELARLEIAAQNRATKRTVLAGSGVTY